MSHDLEMKTDGVASMAFARQVPWHGLGVKVDPSCTPEEIAAAAGIDWTVSKQPLMLPVAPDDEDGDFTYREVPGHKALMRDSDGKIFDVVSDRWNAFQNLEIIRTFRDFCDAGAATMETAGALQGGQTVWALANLGHGFTTPGGEPVKGYLLLAHRHKQGTAAIARVTPVQVVCANTFAMAGGFGRAGQLEARFNHTSAFDPDKVRAAMGLAHERMDAFAAAAGVLERLNISRRDAVRVLAPIYQPELLTDAGELADGYDEKANRTVRGIMEAALKGDGADARGDTAWGLFSGVTFYANHKARGTADSRFTSAMLGDSNNKANRVFTSLLQMADADLSAEDLLPAE